MKTRLRPTTRTVLKTPSIPRSRWSVSESASCTGLWAGLKTESVTADNHHAENSDHRDRAVAEVRHRATTPASTATKTAWPMVPGWLDGERQLLRQGPAVIPKNGWCPAGWRESGSYCIR